MSNPDTLPDSSDMAGPCPRCGRISSFSLSGTTVTKTGTIGTLLNTVVERAAVLSCMGCGQGTTVVEITSDGSKFHGIHWWPPPGAMNLDASVPDDLRTAYDEGMRCLAVQCPHAAVVMFRRLLEGIVADLGSEAARKAMTSNLARAL
jgi:hypothetical protein